MRADVPPDLLAVVDAVRLDEQVRRSSSNSAQRLERVRDVRAREAVEDLAAVALQPGVLPDPERRVRREREQVRQEVAHLVHDLDAASRGPRCRRGRAGRRSGWRARRSACPRRPAGSARRDRCPGRAQSANGCVAAGDDAQAVLLARGAIICRAQVSRRPRRPPRCSVQMPVPISMTDWCISGLTRSFSRRLPSSSDLLDVRAQLARLRIDDLELLLDAEGEGGRQPFSHGRRAAVRARFAAACRGAASERLGFDAPCGSAQLGHRASTIQSKLSWPTESTSASGRRVHEVDRVGHAVLDRELDRVEVVAERVGRA